ncbi:hypothetical protein ACFQ6S_04965 [Streptomyces sp. NPDC056479]|uniref:hypothetical protein n=1 Tax=Streptomyces sp. NPDC056479 TaxID=3345832 RepID=UPI00367E230D
MRGSGLPLGRLSDEALLAGMAAGAPESALAFVRRFQRMVFGIAIAVVDDSQLAEDIAQHRLRLNRPARRRRPRAGVAVAAAAAIALGCGFGGWAVGTAIEGASAPSSPSSEPPGAEHGLLTASLLTPGHRPVGRIFAYTGSPGWIYMSVDLGPDGSRSGSQAEEESEAIDSRNGYDEYPEAGKVSCRLERSDGTSVRIGEFSLDDAGRGYWGAPTPVAPETVSGASLLNADGSVLATAHFDARDN